MPVIKKTTKFTKEIKKPDEFITTTMSIINFLKGHKNELLAGLSIIILFFAVWTGITSYKKYTFSRDSFELYKLTENFNQNDKPDELEKKLDVLRKKYIDSAIGIRSAVLQAKIYENKHEFLKAGQILEDSAKNWKKGGELKLLLLMNSANYYTRAGEYDRALQIYDELLKDPANQKNDVIYIRKAEALKLAGKAEELKQFLPVALGNIQEEITRHRLRQFESEQSGVKN